MSISPAAAKAQRYRVGYALPDKKVGTVIQPSLVEHAKEKGVDLVAVDLGKPLIHQGPFHCIVHKLYGTDWKEQLEEFASKYPKTVIVDPPECIERLHSRISMLEVVKALKIAKAIPDPWPPAGDHHQSRRCCSFGFPKQVVAVGSGSGSGSLEESTLEFPVIAKPVLANGRATSHEMYLVVDSRGLEKVITGTTAPLVLQEFVKHGGVVFKVYVAGDQAVCVKRRSLPDDISARASSEQGGVLAFSQISSCAEEPVQEDVDDHDHEVAAAAAAAEMPSQGFVEALARGLREALGLHLFNFDLIRENECCNSTTTTNKYLVIDINYFPGYAKIPCFEQVLTDFFLKCCEPAAPSTAPQPLPSTPASC